MRTCPSLALCHTATVILALFLFGATPAQAQGQQVDGSEIVEMQLEQAARTATTSAGEVGERQTREDVSANVVSMGRIESRVQNRVQNRIRNRIDRYYDPKANATSPFEIASERGREADRRARQR